MRQAFLNGAHEDGVVFIQSDPRNGFVPCAPSKISVSDVIAIKPSGILLPTKFDTIAQTHLNKTMKSLDNLIPGRAIGSKASTEITLENSVAILDAIEPTVVLDDEGSFEWEAMKGLLRYYASNANGKVQLLAESGRRLDRQASGDRSGLSILGTAELRNLVLAPRAAPALILLKQDGGPTLGWKAGPFRWPMIASPPSAKPCVFATKVAA